VTVLTAATLRRAGCAAADYPAGRGSSVYDLAGAGGRRHHVVRRVRRLPALRGPAL